MVTPQIAPQDEDALAVEAALIEVFRKALIAAHADIWDMETCAEAAHICAHAWVRWAVEEDAL